MATVELHPEAIAEAAQARKWYAERSERAADGFIQELDQAIDRISEAPERWPNYLHGTRRYLMRRYPYFVVYRGPGEKVEVVAIAHGRRKPGYWRRRKVHN